MYRLVGYIMLTLLGANGDIILKIIIAYGHLIWWKIQILSLSYLSI